jgi:hypothetical protein
MQKGGREQHPPALPAIGREGLPTGDAKQGVASSQCPLGTLPGVHADGLTQPAPHAALCGAGGRVAVVKHLVVREAACNAASQRKGQCMCTMRSCKKAQG